MSEKYCVDCANVYIRYGLAYPTECTRKAKPETPVVNLVTGIPCKVAGVGNLCCFRERNSVLPWKCGKSARFFVAKTV